MGYGFKHGGGGGSGGLNFKVVGGDSQPASASENTVWINTDAEITGWVFSPSEPETPAEGMVWVQTGTASETSFNALKKNGIILCLTGAYQYIDGAFTPVEGALYDGEEWLSFSAAAVYLYLAGDTCESVTGGYTAAALKNTSTTNDTSVAVPTVTYGDSSMVIQPGKTSTAGTYRGGIVRTSNKIDCSGYSTLTFEGTVEGLGVGTGKLCLWSEIGSYQQENLAKYTELANGSDPITVDVSDLTGSYYIGFGLEGSNVQITVTMNSLRLE